MHSLNLESNLEGGIGVPDLLTAATPFILVFDLFQQDFQCTGLVRLSSDLLPVFHVVYAI